MSEITLFFASESFFSQKARLYLKEKGVFFNESVVNLQGMATLEPNYLKMNPKGQVPVLQHGDQFIPDSEKIMLYGEENFDGNILLPTEQKDEIMKLHNMIHSVPIEIITFGSVIFPDFVEDSHLPKFVKSRMRENILGNRITDTIKRRMSNASPEMLELYQKKLDTQIMRKEVLTNREKIDECLVTIEKLLNILEEHLTAKHKELGTTDPIFLFGRKMTIADIDLIVLLARLRFIGLEKKYFPKPKSVIQYSASGDSSEFSGSDIPRPALRLYLDNFDRRESFKEVVIKPLLSKNLIKNFLKNKLKEKNTWMITGGVLLTSALLVYYFRKR